MAAAREGRVLHQPAAVAHVAEPGDSRNRECESGESWTTTCRCGGCWGSGPEDPVIQTASELDRTILAVLEDTEDRGSMEMHACATCVRLCAGTYARRLIERLAPLRDCYPTALRADGTVRSVERGWDTYSVDGPR